MTTVIDSFILELNLDPTKFTAGQRDAIASMRKFQEEALRGGNAVEAQSKRVFDLLSSFRRELVTTVGILFGGREAGEFLNYITSFDASVGRLGRTMDMSGTEVAAWGGALRQVGGTTENAASALSGLSGEMSRFQLTGQSAMLPVLSRLGVSLYDQNRNLKTAGELWLDLADAVQGMDPRQAAAFLRLIPGANEAMINFALLGRRSMQEYLSMARRAAPTPDEIAAAQQYQRSLANIDQSATNLGRTLVNWLAPALITVMDNMNKLISVWNIAPKSPQGEAVVAHSRAATVSRFGSPRHFMEWMRDHFAMGDADRAKWDAIISNWYGNDFPGHAALGAKIRADNARRRGSSSRSGIEDYIRAAAIKRGIDPDVAVAVFTAESGLNPGAVGDTGTSFGVTQLHYGGGLGDLFTARTGLKASDPSNWRAAVDFSLDQAKSGGWGPWHAWRGAPWAGIGGSTTSTRSTVVNVGGVTINDSSGNAQGIGRDIDSALQRSLTAGAANAGTQ